MARLELYGSAGCPFQLNYLSICHYLRAWIVSWKGKAYFGFLIAAAAARQLHPRLIGPAKYWNQ